MRTESAGVQSGASLGIDVYCSCLGSWEMVLGSTTV